MGARLNASSVKSADRCGGIKLIKKSFSASQGLKNINTLLISKFRIQYTRQVIFEKTGNGHQ
ncbi:MAG: hypothetical protein BGO55_22270 [Sphingobacteriales bacterium 50-39]|nr:MAG: hypothetical protein BGO55_22270 [Sphingobacteriales bacterium 50-39]